jgi:hypothetical protein
VILVVHRETDEDAHRLISARSSHDCVGLSPTDLSYEGWSVSHPQSVEDSFVASGDTHKTQCVSGVLNRLDAISPADVAHIHSEDRSYVAAEMQALLAYWLTALGNRVLNRPSTTTLLGPSWTQEQWLHAAAAVGIPVVELDVADGAPDAPLLKSEMVTVVGTQAFGGSERTQRWAKTLARESRVALAGVVFTRSRSEPAMLGVTLKPPANYRAVRDALLVHLLEASS